MRIAGPRAGLKCQRARLLPNLVTDGFCQGRLTVLSRTQRACPWSEGGGNAFTPGR